MIKENKMDTSKALEIINAIHTLAEFFGEDFQTFAKSICILDRHRLTPLNKAIELNKEFRESDIIKRGEMLGIKINKVGENYGSLIILDES